MKEIRHILFALLLLTGVTLFYFITKPLVGSALIKGKKEEFFFCRTADLSRTQYSKPKDNPEGKVLFSNNCAVCHSLFKVITGPALSGVESRGPWTDRANLVKWIQNPSRFSAKDTYIKGLVVQYGQLMTAFPQLTNEQIFSILDYIKEASEPMPVAAITH